MVTGKIFPLFSFLMANGPQNPMKRLFSLAIFIIICTTVDAQTPKFSTTVLNGEFGIAAGAAHYFGDLNTQSWMNNPKPAAMFFFKKQFGPYIGLRLTGTYAGLGYSDRYTDILVQRIRNLSFNTHIFELALGGEFNFFRFIPGEPGYNFTPYLTLSAGVFNYDPYAFLQGEKHFLRNLGTEGQGSAKYPDRKPYSSTAFSFPLGMGFKVNVTPRLNLFLEVAHRFTTTDYLDDVSLTYAGLEAFSPLPDGSPSPAMLLQDRSGELVRVPIGIAGRQRGNSQRTDQFITAMIGVSLNLTSYVCPSPSTL